MLITAVVGGGVKNTLRDHTSMQTGYMDGITFNSFMLCVAAGSFLFFSFIFRVPHLGATGPLIGRRRRGDGMPYRWPRPRLWSRPAPGGGMERHVLELRRISFPVAW
jgi:hypothetical protein